MFRVIGKKINCSHAAGIQDLNSSYVAEGITDLFLAQDVLASAVASGHWYNLDIEYDGRYMEDYNLVGSLFCGCGRVVIAHNVGVPFGTKLMSKAAEAGWSSMKLEVRK